MEFNQLLIPEGAVADSFANTLCVTKWNWDYRECLSFQEASQKFVREHKSKKIYIFCNHPHVFTNGRGNERGDVSLEEFDISKSSTLSFPLHTIRRGGGITFHYPGQWIFYPIVAISPQKNLQDLMAWMLKEVAAVLKEDFAIENVLAAKKLMGVWVDRNKIASIGLGVNRFVTEHGLALNLQEDETMFHELQKIYPCGLNPTTYVSLEGLNKKLDNLEQFHQKFLNRIFR